jgi:hypothetical protein
LFFLSLVKHTSYFGRKKKGRKEDIRRRLDNKLNSYGQVGLYVCAF